jgi:hypothetical protein
MIWNNDSMHKLIRCDRDSVGRVHEWYQIDILYKTLCDETASSTKK